VFIEAYSIAVGKVPKDKKKKKEKSQESLVQQFESIDDYN